MVTSGFIHFILNTLHFTVHIRDVCVFLAPTFRSDSIPVDSIVPNVDLLIFCL